MHATKFYWDDISVSAAIEQLDPVRIAAKVPAFAAHLSLVHGGDWPALLTNCAGMLREMSRFAIPDENLRAIDCPILVSTGDRDKLVPVSEALRLKDVLRRGSLLILPGVGHPFEQMPVDTAVAELNRFLDDVE
jgi:pimeloyl-ACP methyl ester carboxylesterase